MIVKENEVPFVNDYWRTQEVEADMDMIEVAHEPDQFDIDFLYWNFQLLLVLLEKPQINTHRHPCMETQNP